MKNVLFDEKIDGSIHLALGQSYTSIGGQNSSSIHWDIVKDLRSGGRIELDGAGRAGERRLVDLVRVALATCAEIPDLEPDDRLLVPALAALGIEAVPAVWDDPARSTGTPFDLVVLRSTWDYAERRDEFLQWATSLPRVVNEVPLLEWNTDKALPRATSKRLACRSFPRGSSSPATRSSLPAEPFVVKPSISAGGRRSAWFAPSEADAAAGARRAHPRPKAETAMVQPYLGDAEEKALVYIDGAYSHALRRRVPLPAGGERQVLYLDEELAAGRRDCTRTRDG